MSAMTETFRGIPGTWSDPVTPEQRDALYRQAKNLDTEIEANRRAIRWGGYVVGGAGLLVGVLGVAAAASVFPLKTVETRVVALQTETGIVTQTVAARDAAPLFTDKTAQRDLMAYVEAREMWVNDVSDLMSRRVLLMSAPDEQRGYEAAMAARNPQSPRNVYGSKASVRVESFRFSPVAKAVTGTAQVWQVRFRRSEVVNGQVLPGVEHVATVTFAWHPDRAMQDERSRAINLTGFQATGYQSGPA